MLSIRIKGHNKLHLWQLLLDIVKSSLQCRTLTKISNMLNQNQIACLLKMLFEELKESVLTSIINKYYNISSIKHFLDHLDTM